MTQAAAPVPGDEVRYHAKARAQSQAMVARALVVLPFLLCGQALAEEGAVVVTTRVVMASNNGHARLHGPELVSLGKSLSLFPYTSYRLLQTESRPVAITKMAQFAVPGGRHLLVQPTKFENGRVSLYVMLMHGQRTLINTVLKLRNRGEFVVAGPQHEDGVLFLSIGAMSERTAQRVRAARQR